MRSPIIVALDYPDSKSAMEMVSKLDPDLCRVKVGKELFTCAGPGLIEELHKSDFEVFLDLKFHDIPNTVAAACRVASGLGVWMLNVHALGGRNMMLAAREAVDSSVNPSKLIAVTILTSLSDQELHEVGLSGSAESNVTRLAALARECGMDGVVCSAREATDLKRQNGDDFTLVTPGIRPSWASKGDQTRIMTPIEAIKAGSDYLVIGRPITGSDDPPAALNRLVEELNIV